MPTVPTCTRCVTLLGRGQASAVNAGPQPVTLESAVVVGAAVKVATALVLHNVDVLCNSWVLLHVELHLDQERPQSVSANTAAYHTSRFSIHVELVGEEKRQVVEKQKNTVFPGEEPFAVLKFQYTAHYREERQVTVLIAVRVSILRVRKSYGARSLAGFAGREKVVKVHHARVSYIRKMKKK